MKKYFTLIVFLMLVAIWAAFFSSMKFFLWWELGDTLQPSLQSIAGYLSLWGILAYLIGWAFASTFLKKYYLFIISSLSFLFVLFAYLVWFSNQIIFVFVITFLGFLYGLWSVVKNVIIAVEIKKTWLPDTVVNALVWIIFVIFVITGTLLGNILFETLGQQWYLVIMVMLACASYISLQLDYDKKSFLSLISKGWRSYYKERQKSLAEALKDYIPDLCYIFRTYFLVILASSFLWSISTVVSQISMEVSIKNFNIEASTAAYIFLFSALWAILWNIVSMKMSTNRWRFWIIFSSLFSGLIMLFPFFIISFMSLSIFAFLVGGFFWISSNLIDGYFVKQIWEEDKKEYGSSTYGLVLSIILFLVMFLSENIMWYFGSTALMMLLWTMMLLSSWILYIKQK